MSATQRKPLRGNQGSAFVISILVLFMLTVLGLALMLTTSTEKEIAINYRWGQQAFFNADAGLEFGKNVLASYALQDGDFQNILPPVRVLGSMTLKPNDVGACADETIAGCRDYQYFIDLDGATRMYIGKVLRDINGRLVQYDFRQPLGNDTLNDIDFDGTSDVQGTVTLWVRRPLVGGADYAQDDRIILTAEGTAPNGQGIGSGRVCVTGVGLYLCSFFWSQYCCVFTTTGGDLMDTARTLEEKRERVLEQMRAIRSMRPGSVTEQYLKVTHKGKRKPVMRGPYWVYTRKEAGKTVGQRLSREDAEQVTKDIEAHRKFVALCKEFETLTMRLGDVEVDAVLAPEKKRPRSRSSRTKR